MERNFIPQSQLNDLQMDYMVNQSFYLAALGLSAAVIVLGLWLVWRVATPSAVLTERQRRQIARAIAEEAEAIEGDEPPALQEEARPAQNAALNRMLRRRNVPNTDAQQNQTNTEQPETSRNDDMNIDESEESNEEGRGPEEDTGIGLGPNLQGIGVKKARKLAEKEERARQREAMELARKKRKEQEELEMEQRRQEKLEELERKRAEERELERLREERKRKEQEEYEALKSAFSVEGEGEGEKDLLSQETHIQEFLDHLKAMKVVFLEDLAAKYNMKPQTIVEKIEELETGGRLTGIIDERGKFIYISKEEMAGIAKFIKQRGRVTLAEIMRESNRLIDLTPQQVASTLTEVTEKDASTS